MPFIDNNQITEDHVIPLAKGGANSVKNLVLTPHWVNKLKGSMDKDQFMKYLKEHGLPYKKSFKDWLRSSDQPKKIGKKTE